MRISDRQKEILKTIGVCALLAGAIIAPNIVQLLKPLNSKKKYKYKQLIKKLANDKIIYLFGEKIELTKKGRELLKRIQIEEITIEYPDKWDGIWHLVSYDIPENKKPERDFFRRKIIELGFKAIQDSLWVIPYNCKEEIAVISQTLGISPFVAYLNTDSLPQQKNLIRFFKLNSYQDEK
ncbi:MAG: hypothetical protein ACD_58C00041G0001 [uncultured bacterium]|nr:MAG: hypothetical protein ACD_58C00041G0001 [uncultured bacterium]